MMHLALSLRKHIDTISIEYISSSIKPIDTEDLEPILGNQFDGLIICNMLKISF
jgi:hypothetical protein